MIEYFRRMFSNVNERSSGTDSSKSFVSSELLQVLLTKFKGTFATKSQISALEKRIEELESKADNAVYYQE